MEQWPGGVHGTGIEGPLRGSHLAGRQWGGAVRGSWIQALATERGTRAGSWEPGDALLQ